MELQTEVLVLACQMCMHMKVQFKHMHRVMCKIFRIVNETLLFVFYLNNQFNFIDSKFIVNLFV